MNKRFLMTACAATLVLVVLAPALCLAQYYPYPPGYYEDDRERRREEKEWRREERRRAREQQRYQQWYDDQWRWNMQRYFGGYVLEPRPGESRESFTRRLRQQCNQQWNRCATYCNTIQNPNRRAACVANCNNELYECNSWF